MMIKDIAWKMFKSTGDVNTFLELKQIEKIQNNISNQQRVELNGNNKDKRDSYFRK